MSMFWWRTYFKQEALMPAQREMQDSFIPPTQNNLLML